MSAYQMLLHLSRCRYSTSGLAALKRKQEKAQKKNEDAPAAKTDGGLADYAQEHWPEEAAEDFQTPAKRVC